MEKKKMKKDKTPSILLWSLHMNPDMHTCTHMFTYSTLTYILTNMLM